MIYICLALLLLSFGNTFAFRNDEGSGETDTEYSNKILYVTRNTYAANALVSAGAICASEAPPNHLCKADSIVSVQSQTYGLWDTNSPTPSPDTPGPTGTWEPTTSPLPTRRRQLKTYDLVFTEFENVIYSNPMFSLVANGFWHWMPDVNKKPQPLSPYRLSWFDILYNQNLMAEFPTTSTVNYWTGIARKNTNTEQLRPQACFNPDFNPDLYAAWTSNAQTNIPGRPAEEQGASTGIGFTSTDQSFLSNGQITTCEKSKQILCACRSSSPEVFEAYFDDSGLLQVGFDLNTNGMSLGVFSCALLFTFEDAETSVPLIESPGTCKFTNPRLLTVSLLRTSTVNWKHRISFVGFNDPNFPGVRKQSQILFSQNLLAKVSFPLSFPITFSSFSRAFQPNLYTVRNHASCDRELILRIDSSEMFDRSRPLQAGFLKVAPCFESFGYGQEGFSMKGEDCQRFLSREELDSNRYVVNTTVTNSVPYTFSVFYKTWLNDEIMSTTIDFGLGNTNEVMIRDSSFGKFPDIQFAAGNYYRFLSNQAIRIEPQITWDIQCGTGQGTQVKWYLYVARQTRRRRQLISTQVNYDEMKALVHTSMGPVFTLPRNYLLGGRAYEYFNGSDPEVNCDSPDCPRRYGLVMEVRNATTDELLMDVVNFVDVVTPKPVLTVTARVFANNNSVLVDGSKQCDPFVSSCIGNDRGLGSINAIPAKCFRFVQTDEYMLPCDENAFVDPVTDSPTPSPTPWNTMTGQPPRVVGELQSYTFYPSLRVGQYRFCKGVEQSEMIFEDPYYNGRVQSCYTPFFGTCKPDSCVDVEILSPPVVATATCPAVDIVLPSFATKVSLGSSLNLPGKISVSNGVQVTTGVKWEVLSSLDTFVLLKDAPLDIFTSAWSLPAPVRPSLSIPSSYLLAGNTYTFRLSYATSPSCPSYSAKVSLTVNDQPFGGSCSRDLETGRGFFTNFKLITANWVDQDLPLMYAFEFKTKADVSPSILRGFTLESQMTTQLSSLTRDGNFLYAVAQDALGARSARVQCGSELMLDPFFTLNDSVSILPPVASILEQTAGLSLDEQLRVFLMLSTASKQTLSLQGSLLSAEDEAALLLWRTRVTFGTIDAIKRTRSNETSLRQVSLQVNALLAGLDSGGGNVLDASDLEDVSSLVNGLLNDAGVSSNSVDEAPESLGSSLIDVLSELAKALEDKLNADPESRRRRLLSPPRQLSTTSCDTLECRLVENLRAGLLESIHALSKLLVPGAPAISIRGRNMEVIAQREYRKLVGNYVFTLGNSTISLPANVLDDGFVQSSSLPTASLPETVDVCFVRYYFNLAELGAPNGVAQPPLGVLDYTNVTRSGVKVPNTTVEEMTSIYFISSLASTVLIDPFNLSEPINITMPLPRESLQANQTLSCGAWDASFMGWSDSGCTVVGTTHSSLTCSCTHASDYTIWISFLNNVGGGEMGVANPIAIAVVAIVLPGIFFLYMLLLYWSLQRDKTDAYWVHAGALVLLSRNKSKLKAQQRRFFGLLREQAKEPKPLVVDMEKELQLLKSKEEQLMQLKLQQQAQSKIPKFLQHWWNAVWFDHSVFGLVNRFDPYYTRAQRATVVVCVLVGNLFVTALLFDLKVSNELSLGVMVGVVITSALIVALPIKFMVRFLFRATEAELGSTMDRVTQIYRLTYVHADLVPAYHNKVEQADVNMIYAFQNYFVAKNDYKHLLVLQQESEESQELAIVSEEGGASKVSRSRVSRWCGWCPCKKSAKTSTSTGGALEAYVNNERQAMKARLNGISLQNREEFEEALSVAKANIVRTKEELRLRCVEAHEEWENVPRLNPRVELLRKQQSSVMRFAALLYDEVEPAGPVRERPKRFRAAFIYVAWALVFVFLVGTLAYCARWVLAYTSYRGPENTNDANYVISTWLLLSFLGVLFTFLLTEPVMQFIRFSLIPLCLRRCGNGHFEFANKGLRSVAPQQGETDEEVPLKKQMDPPVFASLKGELNVSKNAKALLSQTDLGSSISGKAEFHDDFAKMQMKKKEGENHTDYFGHAAFDFVAEVVENIV